MKFEDSYFDGEIRDGFYIYPIMKRAWAVQIKILQEIDRICRRHDIKYFAEWGTLLGAVRHKGFIPWDDDLDVAMLREDFQRFLHYARKELPDIYFLFDISSDEYDQLMARVMNSDKLVLDEEMLDEFYGCPYASGVDIFCIDYLPRDKDEEDTFMEILALTNYAGNHWDTGEISEEEKEESVKEIEKLTNYHFNPDLPMKRQLLELSNKVSAMYWDAGGDEVSFPCLMVDRRDYRLPASCYESTIEMPFENIMIPVPVGYDQILRLRYSENYMVPVKAWGTHDYPFFKSQIEKLKGIYQKNGMELPKCFDMEDLRCILIGAVQYHKKLQIESIREAGFSHVEMNFSVIKNMEPEEIGMPVSGIVISAEELLKEEASGILQFVQERGAGYLLLDTRNFENSDRLDLWVEQNRELLEDSLFPIYLENGYRLTDEKSYQCSKYSEISFLKAAVKKYNRSFEEEKFGICLNVGCANVTGKNIRTFVEESEGMLKMVHMNDNDGFHDDCQMPLTFTTGRGARSTDIFRLIGALNRNKFRGWIVFDTKGLFDRCPVSLQGSFLRLMRRLVEEWEDQMLLEMKLDQPRKQLILFGTGRMAYNYMCEWSHKYPPAFMVDNNPKLWDKEYYGVPIRKPEAILEIPEDQRNVFICNQYYGPVGEQLTKMGISYQLYNDNYYM
ncbi:MAG: LicD family protein [Lachnospiraceae bacterium]|nr:LicD family protein [Lachnospiraceae bacterium]